jgi:hypothetical protein
VDGTHRWKASRTWKAVALAAAVRKVLGSSWPCWRELMRSEGRDRRRHWLGHSACLRPTTLHGRSTRPGGGQPPQGGERMDEVRAGVRGANRVTTRGRRNRLRCRWRPRGSSCPKSARWCRRQGRGGTGGRKSVSQPLVRYGIGRVLVTTSRLQRLVRSIFSLLGEDTSVSKHGGE